MVKENKNNVASDLEALREILLRLDSESVAAYLATQKLDRDQTTLNALDFLYRIDGKRKSGMIPLVEAFRTNGGFDRLEPAQLKTRIDDNGDKIAKGQEELASVRAQLETILAQNAELSKTEAQLKADSSSLEVEIKNKLVYEKHIVELQETLKKYSSDKIDATTTELIANLEKEKLKWSKLESFLKGCIIARKMEAKAGDRIAETDDAKLLREFMLIKWYLEEFKTVPSAGDFTKRYSRLVEEFNGCIREGKEFFKDYLDASVFAIEEIEVKELLK